jgi:glycosyltransferase involved in cell wall biosynthesis
MKISVIIPVYNTERYVAESIDSVLAQTRPPDEVIVVDDGSTDGTPAILESFGARIIALRQDKSGPSSALNTGIARATGNHLAFNDADDAWLPEKLKLQCDFLSEEPEIEAVFGMVRQFISPDWDNGDGRLGETTPDQLGIARLTMLIRRDAFERIGLFDQSLRFIDFVDWYGRAKVRGLRTHMLPDILGLRRLHANNTGRVHGPAQRQENVLALKRMLDMRRRSSQET